MGVHRWCSCLWYSILHIPVCVTSYGLSKIRYDKQVKYIQNKCYPQFNCHKKSETHIITVCPQLNSKRNKNGKCCCIPNSHWFTMNNVRVVPQFSRSPHIQLHRAKLSQTNPARKKGKKRLTWLPCRECRISEVSASSYQLLLCR